MSDKQLKVIVDYVNELSDDPTFNRFSKVSIKALLEQAFAHVRRDVLAGSDVRINNFGTFKLKTRPARKGRNPQTGSEINIEEKQVITFKPTKASK